MVKILNCYLYAKKSYGTLSKGAIFFGQPCSFFDKNSVLLPTQYGFWRNHSTQHKIIDINTSVYDNINNNKFIGSIMLDLIKAFDTVIRELLLNILWHYGIRGTAHKLLSSYLMNRMQYVDLNKFDSSFQ